MKIVRSPRTSHFTTLSNDLLSDGRLSFKARGLLAYLLSRPDGWHTDATRLAALGPDGRRAVLSGLHELEVAGYLKRSRVQDPATGRWATQCEVLDDPAEVTKPHFGATSGNAAPDDVSPGHTESTFSDVGKPHSKELKTEKTSRARTRTRARHEGPGNPPSLAEVVSIQICDHGGRVGSCPSCSRREAQ